MKTICHLNIKPKKILIEIFSFHAIILHRVWITVIFLLPVNWVIFESLLFKWDTFLILINSKRLQPLKSNLTYSWGALSVWCLVLGKAVFEANLVFGGVFFSLTLTRKESDLTNENICVKILFFYIQMKQLICLLEFKKDSG